MLDDGLVFCLAVLALVIIQSLIDIVSVEPIVDRHTTATIGRATVLVEQCPIQPPKVPRYEQRRKRRLIPDCPQHHQDIIFPSLHTVSNLLGHACLIPAQKHQAAVQGTPGGMMGGHAAVHVVGFLPGGCFLPALACVLPGNFARP